MTKTFTAKGNQTKTIQKVLGAGFAVRTNGVCTIVKGNISEAKELLAGFAMVFDFRELGDNLAVWPR